VRRRIVTPEVQIDEGYRAAPVQLERTVNGYPLFFHTRWDGWAFSIALEPGVDACATESPHGGYYEEGGYGEAGR